MTPPLTKFLLIGLLVAAAEEFITQGVVKGNLVAWIIPTIIAFAPFLVVLWLLGKALEGRLRESRAVVVSYLAAGGIGLAFEWSLMGLGPWTKPHLLQIPFQLGMFSFWVAVALAPRLLLDRREAVAAVRRRFRNALVGALAFVYAATLTAPAAARVPIGIVSVLIAFLAFNVFYVQYVRALARTAAECG